MGNKKVPTSSVSQVSNFRSCERKWFFSSVEYLPQEPKRATAIGDVFHAVAERYLDVDESGLKNGKPPELYPEGWHIQKDFFGKKVLFVLDKQEQDIIKNLINKAIDEGILIRRPGAVVEYQEKIFITNDITFQVRIDYAYDWTIEDHKTCKNFRYTLVEDPSHVRYIGKDLQLKVYAYFWALKRHKETGEEIPEYLTIRHNQFCVGPETPRIETPSTQVTFEECKKCYEELKLDVLEQLKVRQDFKKGEITWKDLDKNLDTCGAYGGCPYKQVCVGQETHDMYKKRMERQIKELTDSLKKEEPMGFNLDKGATKDQAAVLEEMNKPAEASPSKGADTLETLEKAKAELLKQCEAMSIDPSLSPKYVEIQESIDKIKEVQAKEEAKAKKKAEEEAAAEAKKKEEAEIKAKAKTEETKATKEEVKSEEVLGKGEVADPDRYKVKAPTTSRSKETFVYINCAPIGSPNVKVTSLHEIFALKSAELAEIEGVDSFYDLPAFARRDAIKRAVPFFFNELEGLHIIAYACDPDEQALLNAIMTQNVRVIAAR